MTQLLILFHIIKIIYNNVLNSTTLGSAVWVPPVSLCMTHTTPARCPLRQRPQKPQPTHRAAACPKYGNCGLPTNCPKRKGTRRRGDSKKATRPSSVALRLARQTAFLSSILRARLSSQSCHSRGRSQHRRRSGTARNRGSPSRRRA